MTKTVIQIFVFYYFLSLSEWISTNESLAMNLRTNQVMQLMQSAIFNPEHLPLLKCSLLYLLSFQYLQNHPQIFQFSPDKNKVGLKEKYKLPFKSNSQGLDLQSPSQKNDIQWNLEKTPTRLEETSADCHWFDLNDSKVQPIKEEDIEQQFQGKESAYMLFYRKSQLKRPPEGTHNSSLCAGGFLHLHFLWRVKAVEHFCPYQTFQC